MKNEQDGGAFGVDTLCPSDGRKERWRVCAKSIARATETQ